MTTGGGGAEIIALAGDGETDMLDYNVIGDAGDTVANFDTGTPGTGDILDLADLLDTGTFAGTTLTNATDDGYVDLVDTGADTEVWSDLDGDAGATLQPL